MGEGKICVCCWYPIEPRDPDPWEGRLDNYCLVCCNTRCDAYPHDPRPQSPQGADR